MPVGAWQVGEIMTSRGRTLFKSVASPSSTKPLGLYGKPLQMGADHAKCVDGSRVGRIFQHNPLAMRRIELANEPDRLLGTRGDEDLVGLRRLATGVLHVAGNRFAQNGKAKRVIADACGQIVQGSRLGGGDLTQQRANTGLARNAEIDGAAKLWRQRAQQRISRHGLDDFRIDVGLRDIVVRMADHMSTTLPAVQPTLLTEDLESTDHRGAADAERLGQRPLRRKKNSRRNIAVSKR